MAEKISAMVVCAIVVVVVVYAVVFLTPEPTNLQVVPNTIQKEVYTQKTKYKYGDWEADRRVRIAEYRREHNLPKKRNGRTKNDPAKRWIDYALQTGVFSSVDRMNHEVAIDPSMWQVQSIDSKWQMMEQVHFYFDGYATIVSSVSGRPLASYNAWSGIKIHD